jgi:hypothetical protein
MPVKRKDLSTVGLETENIQELFRLGWYRVRPEGGTTLRIHNDFLPGLTPLLADMVKATRTPVCHLRTRRENQAALKNKKTPCDEAERL